MAEFSFSQFGIDPHTGFLTTEPPLGRLSGIYEQWETFLDDAKANFVYTGPAPEITRRQRAYGCMWRKRIRRMPVIRCTNMLHDERQLQRAHHVLAFLTQFFVHSQPPRDPSKNASYPICIPSSISVPFIDSSRALGIAPIVTYADTVLWNWDIIDPTLPLSRSNIRIRDLFTGSPQEEHFFLTSARIEIEGWTSLDAMRKIVHETSALRPRIDIVAHNLRRLARSLDVITEILFAVRDGLDPDFFYNRFRPWIQGADQGVDSPSWLFEGVDGEGLALQPSGPSAGQSALMHAFDVFLNVPHAHSKRGLGGGCTRFNAALDPHNPFIETDQPPMLPKDHPPVPLSQMPLTPPATPSTSEIPLATEFPLLSTDETKTSSAIPIDTSFNARMRSYMTQAHQDFLIGLSQHSIRSYVDQHRDKETLHTGEDSDAARILRAYERTELCEAYDDSVMALKRWRDAHIRIVTQFVIVPARRVNGANEPGARVVVDISTGEESEREAKPVRGTGGTSLIPLLKIYRNNTLGRVLEAQA